MKHSKEYYINQTKNQIPVVSEPIKRTPELTAKVMKIGERALRQPTDQLKVLLNMDSSDPLHASKQVYAFLKKNESTYGVPNSSYKETEEVVLMGTESQLLQLIEDAFADKPPLNLLYNMRKIEPLRLWSQST